MRTGQSAHRQDGLSSPTFLFLVPILLDRHTPTISGIGVAPTPSRRSSGVCVGDYDTFERMCEK